ncbi:unnamed protein product [Phytomonas sp. Hart1]|nr:unnamed protein product [Phytomonas sp. Hart1]|eukprot:CCW66064.1 unnamed protein product [Phytomonas sp. isolate Hart1]
MAYSSFSDLIPRLSPCGIPAIGIGTYQLHAENCVQSVSSGIQCGFRLIDTAAGYKNEALVGEGIRKSGIDRSDLFVVVKILLRAMGSKDLVRESIRESIQKLQIGYADCVIMHWPSGAGIKPEDSASSAAARRRCWEVMMEYQKKGLVRYIGASNFLPRHFAEIESIRKTLQEGEGEGDSAFAKPVLNQIELHPLCLQEDVLAYCRANEMIPQQYAPLGENDERLVKHPKLLELQQLYFPQHTIYDMLIMWGLTQGFCTILKTGLAEHHKANFQAAIDYFASVRRQSQSGEDRDENNNDKLSNTPEAKSSMTALTPRFLDNKQLEVIRNLRELMNVKEDMHVCWYSEHIA